MATLDTATLDAATLDAATATGATTVAGRALAWGQASDISARSALVTILGDTVAPLGGTLWLADLIALAEPFGFSERLVRTSMYRLAAEGWVDNERVGRHSRYAITGYGLEEIAAAEDRIYRPRSRPWDGWWTLVFLPDGANGSHGGSGTNGGGSSGSGSGGGPNGHGPDDVARHLRWRGFARMADGVHARPDDHVAETRQLLDRLAVDPAPPVAAARFDGDGEAPVDGTPFRHESGLAEAEDGYHRFVERHRWAGSADLDHLDPAEAFALRTMVVHDLRRARLRDPDLPPALLADDWVGHRAATLAAAVHRAVTDSAWRWVAEVTGRTVDPGDHRLTSRFAADLHPAATEEARS